MWIFKHLSWLQIPPNLFSLKPKRVSLCHSLGDFIRPVTFSNALFSNNDSVSPPLQEDPEPADKAIGKYTLFTIKFNGASAENSHYFHFQVK